MLSRTLFTGKKFYSSVLIILFTTQTLAGRGQADTSQIIIEGRTNSAAQQNKPYLILISVDGLRYDYLEKFNAVHLKKLADQGVRADHMIPSFPTLTFPNHYTIVTGLYPAHHGLVSNNFFDRQKQDRYSMRFVDKVSNGTWYGGTPLWVLAEQQQMLSASFYWVGSEADIQGIRPTYYYRYNEQIDMDTRISTVVNWLKLPEEKRPHFITFYFPEVDHAGHDYGTESEKTAAIVRFIDTSIYRLTEAVKSTGLDVNFMVVSDHGMVNVKQDEPLPVPRLDSNKYLVLYEGALTQIYARNGAAIQPLYDSLKAAAKNYEVYLRKDIPDRLHFGEKDDRMNRIGDIVLIPSGNYAFSASGRRVAPGTHGFDVKVVPEMKATFLAWGPAFKSGKKIKPFENVHVFPIAARLLDLPYKFKIDGRKKIACKVLSKR